MNRLFYLFSFVVFAFIPLACDNGNADTVVLDSPPAITIVSPGSFVLEGEFDVSVQLKDGFNEELSRSPLASASFSIFDSDSVALSPAIEGSFTGVSGISATVNQTISTVLDPGDYFLNISATDTKGNVTRTYKKFEVIANFESVGIIGSGTPTGWDSDTDMTQDASNPALWVLNSITLTDGFAKFRANNSWDVNWGGNTFPSGTGTQGGPDIPVTAGTYKVTLNITNGAYTFEEL